MNANPKKSMDEALQQLRKLKGYCQLTPTEAEAEFDAAPSVPISEERIKSLVESILSGEMMSWEPIPDLGWIDDLDLEEVENDAFQLYRNKGEGNEESNAAEDALRKELLDDEDDIKEENGMD